VLKLKLPNTDKAIIPEAKIRDYLLSTVHPIGRFKFIIFRNLGYSSDNWIALHKDLKEFLKLDATIKERTEYGVKYEIHGIITGPIGKSTTLVTAWIVRAGEDFPRFITAYPGG